MSFEAPRRQPSERLLPKGRDRAEGDSSLCVEPQFSVFVYLLNKGGVDKWARGAVVWPAMSWTQTSRTVKCIGYFGHICVGPMTEALVRR